MAGRVASKKYLTGPEIKAWRITRRVTQIELAEWLGLTPPAVAKYEIRGATKSTALALTAIDRGLKPFKPTRDDLEYVKQFDRMKEKRHELDENEEPQGEDPTR